MTGPAQFATAVELAALAERIAEIETVAHPPIDLTPAVDEILDARGYVPTRPGPPDRNGIAWRPMATVRDVRDGRPILLRFEGKSPLKGILVIYGAAIGHWVGNECEWFLATDTHDLTCGSGNGLIDDDFVGWAPLPDISTAEIKRLSEEVAA